MLPFSNPNLLNAHALPLDDLDPHAQVGNHLRVSHHPLLGLPVAPFLVSRAVVSEFKRLVTRTDMIFTDKNGQVLLPPFDVTPENPATARLILAPKEVCLWAQVEAVAKADQPGGGPVPIGPFPRPIQPFPRLPVLPGQPVLPVQPVLPDRNLTTALRDGQLVCEAFINSGLGPASIGTRSRPRYAFSGPGIVEIKITGSGRVTRVRWVEATDKQHIDFAPFAVLNLPHAGGARYLKIQNAVPLAAARVDHQAPKRRPLQETLNAPAPAAAPLADIVFEKARVKSLSTQVSGDLEQLINNLAVPPLEQILTEQILDENGVNIGDSTMARLHRLALMQPDPGTASFLGYKLRDDDFRETEDRLVVYQIDGFFQDFPFDLPLPERDISDILLDAMIAGLPASNRNWSRGELFERFSSAANGIPGLQIHPDALAGLEDHETYFGAGALAIADRGAPLDPVSSPILTSATHKTWLPAVPPAAKREVQVEAEGLRVAGLLAAGKRTPAGGITSIYDPLNKENVDGFHLPLMASIAGDSQTGQIASEPGTGFIADRAAGPSDIRYFMAQQDRFGRWSDWAGRTAAPGPRPKPPRPQFQAFYTQPSVANAPTTGGEILVKIMVPDPEALAPGSRLLDQLELELRDETLLSTQVVLEPEANKAALPGDPTTFFLHITRTGPILQATELRNMRITAHWIDVAGTRSIQSEPQILKMNDPRPPAQLSVPDQLQYAARPDVTGLSWVEHRWSPANASHSHGIYYTDENRLKAHLQESGQAIILQAIIDAPNAAARSMVYRTNVALFPDHLFEKLQQVMVTFGSGQTGFRHGVSGSLRLLNFYKIATVAGTGAKPVLLDLPMIVYGIPNSDPPPCPSLQVAPVPPETGEKDFVARISIELPAGATLGETWRLRRSSVETGNLNKMPVVSTGAMGAFDADTGLQLAEFRDDGPVQIAVNASLRPWVRYAWVAEVQGAPESGSEAAGAPVPGRWSRASDPVTLILIPTALPEAFVITNITGTAAVGGQTDVQLTLSHSQSLSGGSTGAFTLRLSRRAAAGQPLRLIREQELDGAGPFEVRGVLEELPGEIVPLGAEYIVELIDPVGRASAPATGILT